MKYLETLKSKVRALKQESVVIYFAMRDRRSPFTAKILAAVTVVYLLSPIDLIPDFIPAFGLLDDLVLVPLLITLTLKLIPKSLLEDIRARIKTDARLRKQWYFALPVVLIYAGLLLVLYFKFKKTIISAIIQF